MKSTQAFLCMQDSIHLMTKIRNRLLSKTATMSIDGQMLAVNYPSTLYN